MAQIIESLNVPFLRITQHNTVDNNKIKGALATMI